MRAIPLLQTVEAPAIRYQASVNGFPVAWLTTVRASADGHSAGLEGPSRGYAVLHPYMLKPTGNQLRFEFRHPVAEAGQFDQRVLALDYTAGAPLGTVFPAHELLRVALPGATPKGPAEGPQVLEGEFAWSGGKAWHWTQAPAIADTPTARQDLRAAVEAVWKVLDGTAGSAPPKDWVTATRASMHEFVQASEAGGHRYRTLDELLQVASALKLPGDVSPEQLLAQSVAGKPGQDDARFPMSEPARRADGSLPPRLTLRPLQALGELGVQWLAGGRLARLADPNGKAVIQFASNYADGNRGEPRTVRYSVDLWFRQDAGQHWVLDAIYPIDSASRALENPWPQEVVKQLPY